MKGGSAKPQAAACGLADLRHKVLALATLQNVQKRWS